MLNKSIKPMLLQPSTVIPSSDQFIHQLKLDGHRAIVHVEKGKVTKIFTRHLTDVTAKYPEMLEIELPVESAVLDGEMVCFNQDTSPPVPDFRVNDPFSCL